MSGDKISTIRVLRARGTRLWTMAGALAVSLAVPGAHAESLNDALASSYMGNPTLRAERARQRATDEQVSQAISGWRPTIIAQGDAGVEDDDVAPGPNTTTNPAGVNISLTQPIFRGFRTVNSTLQAESTVAAGQQTLLSVEQTVLLDGVSAYMNVVRDMRIVDLRAENVTILTEQLRGTEARFNVGELTQTDVAQSRARLSQARSDLADARSNLAASRAFYERVVGHAPASLTFPPPNVALLPATLDAALAIAEENNPVVRAQRFEADSSMHAIEVSIGDLLPTVDVIAEYDHREEPQARIDHTDTLSLTAGISVPLYQSGAEHSRVREAKQFNSQQRLEVQEAMRLAHEEVVVAWNLLIAARENIKSDADQVEANELAFRGIQQEALVGSRTILDVLDTNRDLIESRILLVGSQRDEVVASYRLLAAIGRLTARDLGLSVPLYDPSENLERVRNQPWGLDAQVVEE